MYIYRLLVVNIGQLTSSERTFIMSDFVKVLNIIQIIDVNILFISFQKVSDVCLSQTRMSVEKV